MRTAERWRDPAKARGRRAATRRARQGARAAPGRSFDGRALFRPRFAAKGHGESRNALDLRQSRATAIVVTHDAEEAMRMGDRIALLKGGRLAQAGTAEEHYLRPVDLFAAGFFSELNLFDARVVNCRADTPVGQFAAPGHKDGDAVTVAVRLAGFDVAESGGEIEARVVSRRFLGVVGLLELAVPGAEEHVRARVRAGQLSPGVRDIWMNVRPSDVLVFERRRESA